MKGTNVFKVTKLRLYFFLEAAGGVSGAGTLAGRGVRTGATALGVLTLAGGVGATIARAGLALKL